MSKLTVYKTPCLKRTKSFLHGSPHVFFDADAKQQIIVFPLIDDHEICVF
jgi:hypothetical protein